MSTISAAIRARVRQRAGNRCEYCLSPQALVMGRLQIDHVLPLAKGGSNGEDNLCLACELCNQYKWTKTEAVDPQTGETAPLFNAIGLRLDGILPKPETDHLWTVRCRGNLAKLDNGV